MSGDGRRQMIDAGRVSDMLAARIVDLCLHLLPKGRREGPEWVVGGVHGEPGRSMSINLGSRAGVWSDFASGEGGDALDLVAAVQFRGDRKMAFAWSRSWLGLDGLDPGRLAITRAAVEKRKSEEQQSDEERAEKARRLYASAKCHPFRDSPAWAYLTGRAIDFRALGRVPGALAFHPRLWNGEINRPLPGMVAKVQIRNRTVAVHRTWLDVRADGSARKAALIDAKRSLGPVRGGVIALHRGASKVRWCDLFDIELNVDWQPCPADTEVTVTEGIEDALSIAMADPSRRVLAAVSLANMASMILPSCVSRVIIGADNDHPGSKADLLGLPRVIERLQGQGKDVQIARPPAAFKDWNAYLQSLTGPRNAASGASGAAA